MPSPASMVRRPFLAVVAALAALLVSITAAASTRPVAPTVTSTPEASPAAACDAYVMALRVPQGGRRSWRGRRRVE